ncbi:50S ribosomal protein L35 [Mycoplasmoides genitalium]|uniref:Large ribosomal subunit protein bL35 n=2 Tax=Mycoplasmoides genitalium TaxID=2097 RepID=RL35_MYCGE|nr:50S ribosomal protein L35 [Mycoplasmoides genitalium]P47439.1 RecName: Full=Large ribosomal subunit protein bL35; AltName: Full=50S ribosomal protein L35 [Mycoplasmoides genitalium G37]ABY79686.1 ribosomal protein L35 [synthetic Mycoplasma genitalium JCVI-1.0]AAC71415.1 ribosomal protein L35 [Mycoplasmoides genitalium G37]AFQ03028.1 50S ribosomal protein L35 [Mycoplasmoides genitalium M2321]AFQ03516.1 50S ribosomal protein L35 [Mycoplasmoides genitalium M6282]AFQ04016.1 50S ribosomal prote
MKTKSAAVKRFKLTKSGQIKRKHAYTSHLAPHKSTKQKRHLRKQATVSNSELKRIGILI